MYRAIYDLRALLDIENWESIQDKLAEMTGTAIITVDYKGIPITKHSCRTDFCSVIRENPVSRKRCYRCDALASLEAVRAGRPYIYLCHCGIVDVAVPVMVGDRHLGAVMFGQVRLMDNDSENKVERLVNEISSFENEGDAVRKDLMDMYEHLPQMEYKRIEQVADLINAMVCYIVNRVSKANNKILAYDWMSRSGENRPQPEIQEVHDPSLESKKPREWDLGAGIRDPCFFYIALFSA